MLDLILSIRVKEVHKSVDESQKSALDDDQTPFLVHQLFSIKNNDIRYLTLFKYITYLF